MPVEHQKHLCGEYIIWHLCLIRVQSRLLLLSNGRSGEGSEGRESVEAAEGHPSHLMSSWCLALLGPLVQTTIQRKASTLGLWERPWFMSSVHSVPLLLSVSLSDFVGGGDAFAVASMSRVWTLRSPNSSQFTSCYPGSRCRTLTSSPASWPSACCHAFHQDDNWWNFWIVSQPQLKGSFYKGCRGHGVFLQH